MYEKSIGEKNARAYRKMIEAQKKKQSKELKRILKTSYGKCHYCGKDLWLGEALMNKDVCERCFKINIEKVKRGAF